MVSTSAFHAEGLGFKPQCSRPPECLRMGVGVGVDCDIPRSEVEGVEGREEGFEKKNAN